MESELAKNLQSALEEAEREYEALRRDIPGLDNPVKPKKTPAKPEVTAKKTSFGTAKRLETKGKPEDRVILVPSVEAIRKRVTGGAMAKTTRTGTVKEEPMKLPLNPNYDVTLKKAPSAVIRSPVPKPKPTVSVESVPVPVIQPIPSLTESAVKTSTVKETKDTRKRPRDRYEIDESQNSVSTASSEYDDFFKAKAEWDKEADSLCKSMPKLHFKPAAPTVKTGLGPGAYTTNYNQVERVPAAPKFPVATRPSVRTDTPQTVILPSYEAVTWRKPAAIITSPSEKPQALLKKRLEDEENERFAALLQLTTAAGVKDVLKPKVVGGVIPQVEEIQGKPKPEDKLGPGLYHVSYTVVEEAVTGNVKYRVPVSDLISKPLEKRPGPGSYDPDDMATRAEPREAVIGQEVRTKEPEMDMRRALYVKEELVHVQPPRPHIDPEHVSILPPDFSKRLGPGEYAPLYSLVQPRESIGAVKLFPTVEKPQVLDDRVLLYPDMQSQFPNHLVFQYHQPTIIQPMHVPDSDLFPEHWRFYDPRFSLQIDRAPEFDFARGIPQPLYLSQERAKAQDLRHYQFVKGFKPVPAPGAYDPTMVKERAPAYDFGKAEGRKDEEIDPFESPLEGDVLLLNLDRKEHVTVLVDMQRNQGRPEEIDSKEDREELIINPNISIIHPKIPVLVNMTRETGRKETVVDPDEGQGLVLDPRPVEPKVPVLVNMDRQVGRSLDQVHDDSQELMVRVGEIQGVVEGIPGSEGILNPDYDKIHKKQPVLVNMEKMTGREDVRVKDESTFMLLPEAKELIDPTKPRVLGVLPFDRVTGREEGKESLMDEVMLSHPEGLPEVLKSYKSTLPEVQVAAFDRYAQRWDEVEEMEGKRVQDYS